MKVSLITATLGRTEEIGHLLASLAEQSHRDFELIVVDQNGDGRLLEPFLAPYRDEFSILRLASAPGASRARNAGLERATGDVVAFPDDDCWYPPDLLERVVGLLEDHGELDGLTGRAVLVQKTGERPARVGAPRFDKEAGLLGKTNVWLRTISYTIFLRENVVGKAGGFDETLGPGSGTPWVAAEDTDFALSVVEAGFRILYDPDILVYHPALPDQDGPALADRAYKYGLGTGRFWRKHAYPPWFVAYYLLRPAGGMLSSLLKGRGDEARYYLGSLRGRLRGWRSGRP